MLAQFTSKQQANPSLDVTSADRSAIRQLHERRHNFDDTSDQIEGKILYDRDGCMKQVRIDSIRSKIGIQISVSVWAFNQVNSRTFYSDSYFSAE